MKDIVERFLDYVSFETTSYEPIEGQASSVGQYVLAKHLKDLKDSKGQAKNNMFKALGFDYLYVDNGNNIEDFSVQRYG